MFGPSTLLIPWWVNLVVVSAPDSCRGPCLLNPNHRYLSFLKLWIQTERSRTRCNGSPISLVKCQSIVCSNCQREAKIIDTLWSMSPSNTYLLARRCWLPHSFTMKLWHCFRKRGTLLSNPFPFLCCGRVSQIMQGFPWNGSNSLSVSYNPFGDRISQFIPWITTVSSNFIDLNIVRFDLSKHMDYLRQDTGLSAGGFDVKESLA